jgi:mannose-6-phosphate isomerase-like protein (cupin superfamily)
MAPRADDTLHDLYAPRLAGGTIGSADTSIVVAEWADPGGGHQPPCYIAPLHIHHEDDEAWYVLEGTLRVRLGEASVELPAGAAVIASRGTPHTFWNPSPEPARYLLVMTPRIHDLIDAIHAMPSRSREAMEAVFAEHRSEYLGRP